VHLLDDSSPYCANVSSHVHPSKSELLRVAVWNDAALLVKPVPPCCDLQTRVALASALATAAVVQNPAPCCRHCDLGPRPFLATGRQHSIISVRSITQQSQQHSAQSAISHLSAIHPHPLSGISPYPHITEPLLYTLSCTSLLTLRQTLLRVRCLE
jgi:hypothetical protein